MSRGHLDNQESLERGVVLVLTVPEACPESQAPRVTEDSTDFLVSLERRDTGEKLVLSAL